MLLKVLVEVVARAVGLEVDYGEGWHGTRMPLKQEPSKMAENS